MFRLIERPQSASEEGSPDEEIGRYVEQLVREGGYSIESFRRKHHIALGRNIKGREQVTRQKFAAVLQSLQIDQQEQERHWQMYIGDFEYSVKGVVLGGIRRYGLRELEHMSGVSSSTIYGIAGGERHANRKNRDIVYPSLALWLKLAQTMKIDPEEAENMWNEDVKEDLMKDGLNELGAEVELLFRSSDISINKWLRTGSSRTYFPGYSSRQLKSLVHDLRNGELRRWEEVRAFLQGAGANERRRERIIEAWMKEVQMMHGITAEMIPSSEKPEWDGLFPQRADWLQELRAATSFIKESKASYEPTEAELEELAINGDTVFQPGSLQRIRIMTYRYAHQLPIFHKKDIKHKHAFGTGRSRIPLFPANRSA